MRILNAVSRRGTRYCPPFMPRQPRLDHQVMLSLDVNQKQVGQLYREWYWIPDVIRVGSGAAHTTAWTSHHPPAGVALDESRPAARA